MEERKESNESLENDGPNTEGPLEMSPNGITLVVEGEAEGRQRTSSLGEDSSATASHILPPQPERTLKEKLVERERQKRIETERARLKRQFALSHRVEESAEEEGAKEDESIVGTVGSVAANPPDIEGEDQEGTNSEGLGYAMERFLLEREAVVSGETNGGVVRQENVLQENETGGVVMERFLAEPVVPPTGDVAGEVPIVDPEPPAPSLPEPTQIPASNVHRSDSVDGIMDENEEPANLELHGVRRESDVGASGSFSTMGDGMDANAATVDAMGDIEGITTDPGSPMQATSSVSSGDQPRVFRLTEREIQEMAAIEEASIGNAPPSEREDTFSEVGDLIGGFGDVPNDLGGMSVQTVTTASASMTSVGGHQSEGAENERIPDHNSIDQIATASVSSHLALSPGASNEGSVSITANPPSVIANEDPLPSLVDDVIVSDDHVAELMEDSSPTMEATVGTPPELPLLDLPIEPTNDTVSPERSPELVNRRIRPGMVATPPRRVPQLEEPSSTSSMKRSVSLPQTSALMVDGFDFDKNDFMRGIPRSPLDSYKELPGGSRSEGLDLSPLYGVSRMGNPKEQTALSGPYTRAYGATGDNAMRPLLGNGEPDNKSSKLTTESMQKQNVRDSILGYCANSAAVKGTNGHGVIYC